MKDLSPDRLRIRRDGRICAVVRFVGDKPITEIAEGDGVDWSGPLGADGIGIGH